MKSIFCEHVKHLSLGLENFCHMGTKFIVFKRGKELKIIGQENKTRLRGISNITLFFGSDKKFEILIKMKRSPN